MPLLDQIREQKLIELAKTRFDPDLKPAELKVLHDSASSEDLPEPDEKTPRPEVRPAFLRWLAIDPEAAPHIDPKGLRVYAATISGKLDLEGSRILVRLDFRCCTAKGEINLQQAESRDILFLGSSLEGERGFSADMIDVHGSLVFQFIESEGEIRLPGARIKGELDCSGAKLKAKGYALITDGAKIGSNVFLKYGFESEGEIRLYGAEIEGNLDCSGAKLKANGDALSADGAKISGDVFLIDGFESEGTIRLRGAEIGGDLSIRGAKVSKVLCRNTTVKGDLVWQRIEKSWITSLTLVGAKVKNLRDDRMSWPEEGNLDLDGLVYEGLKLYEPSSDENIRNNTYSEEMPLVARDRIAWLELQPEEDAAAQPWVQLANLLNASGDPDGAREVLYEYQRRSRGRNLLLRAGTYPSDRLEQWPLDICAPIASLGLIGSLIYWRAHRMKMMAPTDKEAFEEFQKSGIAPQRYTLFNPVMYAIENVLPVVKLGQDSAWQPNTQAAPGSWLPDRPKWLKNIAERWAITRWIFRLNCGRLTALRWSLILLGWALAIILAGAIGGIFKP